MSIAFLTKKSWESNIWFIADGPLWKPLDNVRSASKMKLTIMLHMCNGQTNDNTLSNRGVSVSIFNQHVEQSCRSGVPFVSMKLQLTYTICLSDFQAKVMCLNGCPVALSFSLAQFIRRKYSWVNNVMHSTNLLKGVSPSTLRSSQAI